MEIWARKGCSMASSDRGSMVVIGVVGVLALSLVLMELVCGKILEGSGTLYLGLFCMKLEMDQKCSFG